MLAELIAVLVVSLLVLVPASYLLRLTWKQGGIVRKLTYAVMLAACALIAWLLSPLSPDLVGHDRIVFFIGAWGILFMIVGILTIGAVVVGKLRGHSHSQPEK